jgi:hypothetical protein
MPTHRDYPWERDERAAGRPMGQPEPWQPEQVWPAPARDRSRPRPRPRPLMRSRLNTPLARGEVLAALVSVAIAAALWLPGELSRTTGAVRAPAAAGSVMQLHTSFAGPRTLQVWGPTAAPDGSTVDLEISSNGTRLMTYSAPVVSGRFLAQVRIPEWMRHRALRVSAVLAP